MPCDFSYNHYKEIIELAKGKYKIMTMQQYNSSRPNEVLVLRHDIDANPRRALRMAQIERKLDVRSTYFVRVHAEMYNPFGFKTYRQLSEISRMGHEIGLHLENLDFSHITEEDPSSVLRKETQVLQTVLGIKIRGVAAHRGFSGIDNSDFVRNINLSEFDLEYEAHELTKDFLFVSDSLRRWTHTNGRCICQIVQEDHPRICLLIHPQFWYRTAYYLG